MAKKQHSGVFKKSELSSARDFDNKDFVPQEISPEYREAVAARAIKEKWNADHLRESEIEFSVRMVEEVELHDYSIIVYGKAGKRTLIPACRDTSNGGFIMLGPEILKLFALEGCEQAYTVWEALQHIGFMHHSIRDGAWVSGAAPVLISELRTNLFPKRSDKWIMERIKEIERIAGMLKEPRRNNLTREIEGYAYYPFLTYPPNERVHYGVTKNSVDRFDEAGRFDGVAFKKAEYDSTTSSTTTVAPIHVSYETINHHDSVLYEQPQQTASLDRRDSNSSTELFSSRYKTPWEE